jgi:hypothetical protein
LELEGLELEELEDSNIPIISTHINFHIYIYIFLCVLEVSNKNLWLGIGSIGRFQ